ncbi:MAG: excinuclease ABC subunit UvrA [Prevotella sp.]|nr:excinuclease ABC subunit UvrA [Prevotella sp.]
MTKDNKICVWGARTHNLKNIDCEFPRGSLTVITGLSGSGKSSLAFDTIFAEGQRRYVETFSAYARNFLANMERPDVDKITGLSPVISIDQKTVNRNPRSTVGTQTEIYDFLRLLYARAGEAFSYATGEKMVKYTEEKVVEMILKRYAGRKIQILAPVVRSRKGHYRELFESLRKKGFLYVRVDGEQQELVRGMKTDRYRNHDIEVVVDRLKVGSSDEERLRSSVRTAMKHGDGLIMVLDADTNEAKFYSKRFMCPTTGISYPDPAPNNFSFNSPQGACPVCKGLGVTSDIDMHQIAPDDSVSIGDGAIIPLGKYHNQLIFWQLQALLANYGCDLHTPLRDIPPAAVSEVFNGTLEKVRISKDVCKTSSDYFTNFDGIIKYLRQVFDNDDEPSAKRWAEQFMRTVPCPECLGKRLNREALCYKFFGKNIAEAADLSIADFDLWVRDAAKSVTGRQGAIAKEILKEIASRTSFLLRTGLDYLSLSRPSATLSGGESQRIRLATQIGSRLVNVLYILDEPSIGLHPRDNNRLIASLKELRDIGNTVIVVEHDEDMMLAADYIIDIGPRAGRKGGEVVFQGTPQKMLRRRTLTADYLSRKREIEVPRKRRKGSGKSLVIKGCTGNNLKAVDATFPLGKIIAVTGVSGSGKSTLVNATLQPALAQHFYRALKKPLPFKTIEGIENIDKVVTVDQSPIGRTPRSNPATYTGVFSDIRALFVSLPEAKLRGYAPGRFSFNVKGGRCEECGGNGYKTVAMNFLPDVTVPCEACRGRRYNRETLEVRFHGKSIADVLDMTVNQAVEFFENIPQILRKIKTMQDTGLGYIKLGQPSTTLSGGESQRIKLAAELARKDTGKTLYLLDEPTTGLHFEDIRALAAVLGKLVDKGNTVIVIEHNLDIVKLADHVIDLGPGGGKAGGKIVFAGTPEQLAEAKVGFTAEFLKKKLESQACSKV